MTNHYLNNKIEVGPVDFVPLYGMVKYSQKNFTSDKDKTVPTNEAIKHLGMSLYHLAVNSAVIAGAYVIAAPHSDLAKIVSELFK